MSAGTDERMPREGVTVEVLSGLSRVDNPELRNMMLATSWNFALGTVTIHRRCTYDGSGLILHYVVALHGPAIATVCRS